MKFNETLTQLVRQDLEAGIVPALMGEPGIGKSSFMEDLAYQMGSKCFTVQCNLLADKADLTGGRLMPTEDGSYKMSFFPHEDLVEAIEYAEANPREYPIAFLDEINRTTSDVTSAALGISTARKIGRTRLPSNLRLAVAGNLRGNVTSLDSASLSRFAIYEVEPDAATLIKILGDALHPAIRETLIENPNLVFQKPTPSAIATDGDDDDDTDASSFADLFDSGEEMAQITTPRTIENLSKWLNKNDLNQLSQHLAAVVNLQGRETTQLNEIVEAHVGNTQFATMVVAKIASAVASGSGISANSQITVPEPNCYRDLKAVTTITDLTTLIAGLTDNERSGALLFAMTERMDNTRLIGALAQAMSSFQNDHMRTLFAVVSAQQVDRQNLEAFLDTDTPIANGLKPMLAAFL